MYLIKILLILQCMRSFIAKDATSINFITSFIINERKPTFLIFYGLCWDQRLQVRLSKEISKIGGRSSESLEDRSKFQHHALLYLIDLDCDSSEEVINNATSKNLFRFPYRWLVLTNSSDGRKWGALEGRAVLADSDLVLAKRSGDFITLEEMYRISPNKTMVYTNRGYFNGSLTDVRVHRELYQRRRNLMGHALTMANVIQDSNSTRYHLPRENGLEPQHDIIPKICWMNARLAFEMLNATPRYIFSYRWGYKVNGQWSGMINDLHTNRADLGTNCVVSDTERLDVVAFTDVLAPFRVRFIFRQPPLAYVSNIFSLPFSGKVWAAICFCVFLSTIAIYAASKCELKIGKELGPTQLGGGFGDALLLTMSAVSQQGCVMEPTRAPGRIMLFVTFTALMALYAAYSANIIVLLQAPSNSIRSLAQLAASNIKLAAYDVDYNRFVFQLYKDPVHVAIYKRVDPENRNGQFYTLNDGVDRIRKGLFAFHSIVEPVYRRIEETFLESEKCDLTEVNLLSSYAPFVPVKKDSPYLELLRVTFKQIRESGIQAALNKRYQVPKPRCLHKTSAFSSVGLLDMGPVLFLMLYGVALSLCIFFMEIIIFKM